MAAPDHSRPRVLVVTVNYRSATLAASCVRSVAAQHNPSVDLRMTVADNASPDEGLEPLAAALADVLAQGWLSLAPLPCNGGFGWANNQAVLQSCAEGWVPDYIWFLNPDCEARPGALAALLDALQHDPAAGAVGSQLLDEAGVPCASAFRFPGVRNELFGQLGLAGLGVRLGIPMVYVAPGSGDAIDWLTGASFMVRRQALEAVGLFDDGFFLYFEEVELMHRLHGGNWAVRHVPASLVAHVGGASTGVNDAARAAAKPRPAYWFVSRRRYVTRTRGPATALLASLSWQAGSWLGPLLARLRGRTPPTPAGPAERATMRHVGLAPAWHDRLPAIARLGDAPGALPRWMEWQA